MNQDLVREMKDYRRALIRESAKYPQKREGYKRALATIEAAIYAATNGREPWREASDCLAQFGAIESLVPLHTLEYIELVVARFGGRQAANYLRNPPSFVF